MYVECKTEAEWLVFNLIGIQVVEIIERPRKSRVFYEDGKVIEVGKQIAEQIAAALVNAA